MKKSIFIFIHLLLFFTGNGQLSVSTNLTPTNLVNSVLLGPGVVATNIQYTGANRAIGYFSGTSNIGLNSGVILSTGAATTAVGPNNSTNATAINSTAGHPQLTAICGQPTNDAAILEFDFVPSSDTIKFKYVFASEEYYEGVCTPYNDVFAFLISGPGITGTANIALIPGTNKAVSISSVNGGVLGQSIYGPSTSYSYCNLSYTNFYVDNVTPPGTTIQYDGFTKVFTAKAKVIPCQTYHIKMAVADGGNDNTWDSAVFLEAGSFNSHYLTVNSLPQYRGCIFNNAIAEGTGTAKITLQRFDSIPYPRTLNYTISGTATSPFDYAISPPNISFLPGFDTTSVYITPLSDAAVEGIETVSLTIVPDFIVCTGWTIPGGEVRITEPPELNPDFTSTNPFGCEPFCVQFNNTTSGTTTATWSFGDSTANVQSPVVTHCYPKGTYDITLFVVNNAGCKDTITKSGYITAYEKPFADFVQRNEYITWIENNGIFQNSSLNAAGFSWSVDGIYQTTSRNLEYRFPDTGCYLVQLIAINGTSCSDTTEMNVCVTEGFTFWAPNSFSPDGDGINDVFIPKGTGWMENFYSFEIINRWGSTVFKTTDQTASWDGKTGGQTCTDDIYVWIVNVRDLRNRTYEFKGHLLIMR